MPLPRLALFRQVLCSLLILTASHGVLAAAEVIADPLDGSSVLEPATLDNHFQAAIELHSADELRRLLSRAEQLVVDNNGYSRRQPVTFVLTGAEIRLFTPSNYQANRELIDLAARLDAFEIVDLKVCESWMASHGLSRRDLPAFIDFVSDGPQEVQRLETSGYVYF
ncbi:hypothetical protein [Oceanobacter mangrovi]|uniref:hypothetical protein n=1 Tax=Oceanobacter mangrovi TaxID=2862510 RepID=UPI001C8DF552|nr:hypothetical protein [Oceanobacter mangrovi]